MYLEVPSTSEYLYLEAPSTWKYLLPESILYLTISSTWVSIAVEEPRDDGVRVTARLALELNASTGGHFLVTWCDRDLRQHCNNSDY